MENEVPKRKYRLILDFKCQFPEKLYDVANDGMLVQWTRKGSVTVRSEEAFEENVMKMYPGFLQCPSFLNFKRLFREYGFDRDLTQDGDLEWSHPYFIRGRRDLVRQIKTRRKSYLMPPIDDPAVVSQENLATPGSNEKRRKYAVRKRKKTQFYDPSKGSHDLGGGGDVIGDEKVSGAGTYMVKTSPRSSILQVQPHQFGDFNNVANRQMGLNPNINANAVPRGTIHNTNSIIENYAEKEFNEAEYHQWIAKKRKMEEMKGQPGRNDVEGAKGKAPKSNEFWWMYENKTGGNIVNTVNLSTKQSSGPQGENCTPCGFCKCCSAISNYVHLFGEIPENIQVIDCLEEVVASQESAATDAGSVSSVNLSNGSYAQGLADEERSYKNGIAINEIVIEEGNTGDSSVSVLNGAVESQNGVLSIRPEIVIEDNGQEHVDDHLMEIIADDLTKQLASEFVVEGTSV